MDEGLVTHYMGCLLSTGCAMAMNIMRRVFLQLKIQFFCERESFTLVALSLASVYLVVLFSTWGTRFKLQSERLLSSSLSLSMCRWNSPLSQSADTFDSSPVFPLGFPLSVWASASQQPVGQENYNTDEGAEGEDWNWSKRINIIKWRVKKVRLDENIKIFIFIFCFPANKIVAPRKYAKIWKEENIFLDWRMRTYRKLWLCLSELGLICVVGFHRCVQLMQHFEHLSIVMMMMMMMMMMMTEKMMMKNSFNVLLTNERIKQRSVWYKSVNFSQSINW